MEDRHRASEYEAVRKEMTDRLLWVYALLPTSLTTVVAYLAWVNGYDLKDKSGETALLMVLLTAIVAVFCFVTRSLLCNIYSSGSYLIVHHELDSPYQYLFRSRFRHELAISPAIASNSGPRAQLTDTAPTTGLVYLALAVIGNCIILLRFAAQSSQFEWLPFLVVLVVLVLFVVLLLWLLDVKTAMKTDLQLYLQGKSVDNAETFLEELGYTRSTPRQSCPDANKEGSERTEGGVATAK